MDGACFIDPRGRQNLFGYLQGDLERVSIKGARWIRHKGAVPAPIPQATLIRFVKKEGKESRWLGPMRLKWFRSDLTPENVAMLQVEHPAITFAS
jgi:hypothetical protein